MTSNMFDPYRALDPSTPEQTCSQAGCVLQATYRFTWPGREPAYICAQHLEHLKRVADALGLGTSSLNVHEIGSLVSRVRELENEVEKLRAENAALMLQNDPSKLREAIQQPPYAPPPAPDYYPPLTIRTFNSVPGRNGWGPTRAR